LKLEEISELASKEYSLEKSLDQMQADWANLVFEVYFYA
jgi:dynein heavy chain